MSNSKSIENTTKQFSFLNISSAFISNIVTKSITAPIERIKLIRQCQEGLVFKGLINQKYVGIIDCVRSVFTNDGKLSLWKGNFANILKVFPNSLSTYLIKESGYQNSKNPNSLSLYNRIFISGSSGIISLYLQYPLEYARVKLSLDLQKNGIRQFSGIIDVFSQTLKTDGIYGIFRGISMSFLGIFVYRGCYFGIYDSFKGYFVNVSFYMKFIFAYSTTIASSFICYPLDTINKRLIITSTENTKFKNYLDCISTIRKREGIKSFYYGITINFGKSISGAILLTLYDMIFPKNVKKKDSEVKI